MIAAPYSAQLRAERFIAAGRVVLAACALVVAFAAVPEILQAKPRVDAAILGLYALYAVSAATMVWRARRPLARLRLITHVIDVFIFAAMYISEHHLASGFFVFFVFSLLSATLRWQWQGTLSTASVAFGFAIAGGLYQALTRDAFDSNRFLIRGLYLIVIAILLGYLGVYEVRLRREVARLASWSTVLPDSAEAMVRELLARIAESFAAPRVLLLWEDPEEPWVNVALWSGQDLTWTREAPDALAPVTSSTLAEADFFCTDAGATSPVVVYASGDGFAQSFGSPLNSELVKRFSIGRVLSVRFESANLIGRVLWLDKPRMSTDQLAYAQLVGRQVSARIEHFHLVAERRRAAAEAERVRLARDLHDGLLQSLTAMALKLEEIRALVEEAPAIAQKRLIGIQRLIVAEQRYLRFFIRNLKPFASPQPDASLNARLELLSQRVELEWSMAVDLRSTHVGPPLSAELSDELYYLISEALVNAARHAKASTVRVELGVGEEEIRIQIADNGQGFPFRGRYGHEILKTLRLAPVTLGERVDALQGDLTIESTDNGSHIEICVPRRALQERT